MKPNRSLNRGRILPLASVALPLLVLGFTPMSAKAQFTYTTNNGAITITGYTGPGGAVTIPDTITGLPVVGIGVNAFQGFWNVTIITIPDSVTNIGAYAFQDCSSLNRVTIGSGVTSIEGEAFAYCHSLRSVTIPNSVMNIGYSAFALCSSLTNVAIGSGVTSVGSYAFSACSALTSISIPNSVTSIGGAAFQWCASVTNVTIGNSVISIGDDVFYYCQSLTSITIPNSVTSIGYGAFAGCNSLNELSIPDGVASIGRNALAGCTSLTNINVDTRNGTYSSRSGVLLNKSQTTLIQYPAGNASAFYSIPVSVTGIGDGAFAFCQRLTSVIIPNNVASIGNYAFEYCTNLIALYFQGNAPSLLGSDVFDGDSNLTIYYLPGTTGWSPFPTFAGVPAVLWNPRATMFSVMGGQFGFNITGPTNVVIVVEASTNLVNPVWSPVSTNTLTGGASSFSDLQSSSYPRRFYRFRSP